MIIGFCLILLFFLFCGAIYLLASRNGGRLLTLATPLALTPDAVTSMLTGVS